MKKEVTRTYYEEALRYIDNAEETLKKSPKEGNYYTDLKYVKSAGGIAYAGIEKAAKWFIELSGKEIGKGANEREIVKKLALINKKALQLFNNLYSYLHIAVYYNDNNDVDALSKSFINARKFITYLKPYNKEVIYVGGGKIEAPHSSIGTSKQLGITTNIIGHDMIAKCDCGEKFSYQNSKKNILWKCPKCNSIKKITNNI